MYNKALPILLSLFGAVICEQHIIRMKTGETLEITNDKYPEPSSSGNEMWMLGTDRGGAIKLECDDIRINSQSCAEGKLMVSAGDTPKTICDKRTSYSVTSLFESLYVEVELNGGQAAFKCIATALSSPAPIETHQIAIHVKKGETNNELNQQNIRRVKLYEYIVTTDPGSKLRARCSLMHSDSQDPNLCNAFSVTLKSGGSEEKYCEPKNDIIFYSEDDVLKVDLKSGLKIGNAYFYCNIRSLPDGTYSKYKQIASEEFDSSEHGLAEKRGHKSTTCNCGWANKDVGRIIFGHDTGEHEYPWSVSLQYLGGFHFCGGSIISEYHVLTAAHCIHTEPEEIQVVMGSSNYNKREHAVRVKEIILHDYNKQTNQNDIAILVLQKKIEFNQFIGPVCLPARDPKIDHQYVTAMGWGRLGEGEYELKDPAIQKETKLRIVDVYSCTLDWNFRWDLDTAKVICTWSNHTDICLGDSGGPVVWLDPDTNRYTLVGMPALCDGCRLTLPSVHTSVYQFYDWIQTKIAGSAHPEGKICTKID